MSQPQRDNAQSDIAGVEPESQIAATEGSQPLEDFAQALAQDDQERYVAADEPALSSEPAPSDSPGFTEATSRYAEESPVEFTEQVSRIRGDIRSGLGDIRTQLGELAEATRRDLNGFAKELAENNRRRIEDTEASIRKVKADVARIRGEARQHLETTRETLKASGEETRRKLGDFLTRLKSSVSEVERDQPKPPQAAATAQVAPPAETAPTAAPQAATDPTPNPAPSPAKTVTRPAPVMDLLTRGQSPAE